MNFRATKNSSGFFVSLFFFDPIAQHKPNAIVPASLAPNTLGLKLFG
jgi:hypothetical protein